MDKKFKYTIPADCFCNEFPRSKIKNHFCFDEKIIEFIEEAVEEKLRNTK